MQTNNRTIVISLSAILLAAFFMPWIEFFISISGWDMIFSEAGQYVESSFKYLVLLIPIAAGLVLYHAAFKNEQYPVPKQILFLTPIVTLVALILVLVSNVGSDLLDRNLFGIGFWLTLIAAVILPFRIGPVPRSANRPAAVPQPLTQPERPSTPIEHAPQMENPVHEQAGPIQKASYSTKAKIGMGLAVIGVFMMVISMQNHLFSETKTFRVDPGASGLPDAYNIMGPVYDSTTYIDYQKKNLVLYTGLAALLLGGYLFASERKTLTATSANTSTAVAGAAPAAEQIGNAPRVDWEASFLRTKQFLNKYKILLITSAVVITGLVVVYNLFIKDDPVKDGKGIAGEYCNCSEEMNKKKIDSLQAFYDGFESRQFKTRLEARKGLTRIVEQNDVQYAACTQTADRKFKEKLADYKAGENADIFLNTYSSVISACNNNPTSEALALQNKIDEKINTIVDPEPDIEKIKNDLIGMEIPGWKFSYLNEFKTADIISSAKGSDRLEYQVKFSLIDNSRNEEHDCEAMVIYMQNENGWYINEVKMNYITYMNTFYPDRYVTITPLPGCTWSAENTYRMSWKTSDWAYAGETITGPSVGPTTIPFSTTYYIKSLENSIIHVKFTYRPKE